MALTRKLLKTFGLEESVVDSIIEAHTETVDALKKQRDEAAAELDQVREVTRERDELKKKVEALEKNGGEAAKVQADFDAYKQQIAQEKADALNTSDILEIAKEAGVQRESFRHMIEKAFDKSKIKRGEDNKVSNRDELVEAIKTGYPDCIAVTGQEGTQHHNPPTGGGGMTKETIMKIKDPVQRQNAIAQHIELFQKG